mmetsp:Transcript_10670/g.18750  ORF Transcript_10670/g.18750 Transcript_10670/m.18750 type:complete len:129 (-) Transcript_10670:487-873(-)
MFLLPSLMLFLLLPPLLNEDDDNRRALPRKDREVLDSPLDLSNSDIDPTLSIPAPSNKFRPEAQEFGLSADLFEKQRDMRLPLDSFWDKVRRFNPDAQEFLLRVLDDILRARCTLSTFLRKTGAPVGI